MFANIYKLTLLLALVFISTRSYADNLSVRYGQGSCNYVSDTSTGKSLEFYGDIDDLTNAASIGFKYIIEFQKPTSYNPCQDIHSITTQRMQLDLEEQRLDLELFKARLEREAQEPTETPTRLDDDW
jgi:hypothetical protein